MKRFLLFAVVLVPFLSSGQSRYFVYLKDKAGSSHQISSPSSFLSQRSIARRQAQNIPITSADLPVSETYVSQIRQVGFRIVGKSRWLNAVLVEGNPNLYQRLRTLSFVSGIEGDGDIRGNISAARSGRIKSKLDSPAAPINYGESGNQIRMIGSDTMHARGYTGRGVLIGVIDAGFIRTDQAEAFAMLRAQNRIKRTYNYVHETPDVYRDHTHGTNVLSTISGVIPGRLIGTAPEAEVALYVSEDNSSETRQEEVFWTFAAEDADSLGVDIINTSLGYYNFDDESQNYTYEDMDGNTSIIVKAANYATKAGIITVNSAGNEGNSFWRYISTPADGEHIIAVGAVNPLRNIAGFSSVGPAADGRVKPDVSAMGQSTILSNSASAISAGNGTSYASPIIAGFMACLKQQFPQLTALQLREALLRSADRYTTPDEHYGYGIPSYGKALEYIYQEFVTLSNETQNSSVLAFPNPISAGQTLKVEINGEALSPEHRVSLIESTGKVLFENMELRAMPLKQLSEGIYILNFSVGGQTHSRKLAVKK